MSIEINKFKKSRENENVKYLFFYVKVLGCFISLFFLVYNFVNLDDYKKRYSKFDAIILGLTNHNEDSPKYIVYSIRYKKEGGFVIQDFRPANTELYKMGDSLIVYVSIVTGEIISENEFYRESHLFIEIICFSIFLVFVVVSAVTEMENHVKKYWFLIKWNKF